VLNSSESLTGRCLLVWSEWILGLKLPHAGAELTSLLWHLQGLEQFLVFIGRLEVTTSWLRIVHSQVEHHLNLSFLDLEECLNQVASSLYFPLWQFWTNITGNGLERTAISWDKMHGTDDHTVSHKQFSSQCNKWHRHHASVTQVDLHLLKARKGSSVLLHAEAENSANQTASAGTHCSNSEWAELTRSTMTTDALLKIAVQIHELLHTGH